MVTLIVAVPAPLAPGDGESDGDGESEGDVEVDGFTEGEGDAEVDGFAEALAGAEDGGLVDGDVVGTGGSECGTEHGTASLASLDSTTWACCLPSMAVAPTRVTGLSVSLKIQRDSGALAFFG
jgi:hypothetical protein